MISTTISHYDVLEKLGEGGMGVVYKAEDPRLGRYLALKLLSDGFADNPQVREHFKQEARAASALNHPNICTVYDVGEDDDRVFIAIEFLDGTTVKELIRRGPLKLDELIKIASQVLDGLEAAHAEGILHRDIKPANIFVTRKGAVKILDFGLAKMTGPSRTAGVVASAGLEDSGREEQLTSGWGALGTTAYMSPEQALGKPLDARTDLFSFGIVLYEMATGQPPFRGDTTGSLFLAVVQEIPEAPRHLNPDLPDELQRIISKCLEKDRELRYKSASDIRSDLQRLQPASGPYETGSRLASHAVVVDGAATPQSPASSSWPSGPKDLSAVVAEGPATRRNGRLRKIIIAAAALLVAAIVATGLYLRSRKPGIVKVNGGIVLADFTNTTGNSIFDRTLRQAMAIDLDQSPFLNVVSDRTIAATLKQMERSGGERLTHQVAREVCLRTNSKVLVAGSIAQAGEGYLLTLKAVDCAKDLVLTSVEAGAESRYSVMSALHKADGQLRRKLGESLASLQQFNVPLVEATTVSLEALQAYSQGQAERQATGSLAGIPYLKRAVDIDPNFAQAQASLGAMYVNTSQWELASTSFSRAYELRTRVSERERFYIEFNYFTYVLAESDKAVQVCQQWIRSYPNDSLPHSRLGQNYLNSGQFQKATEEYREALRLGTDTPYSGLMSAYMGLGRLDEAKATFEAALAHNRDSDFLRLNRYTLAFLEKDGRAMQEQVDWAKGKAGYEDHLLNAQSNVEAYFGRLTNARDLEQHANLAAAKTNVKGRAAEYDANSAWREAETGNIVLARKYATEALALSDAPGVRETVAMASARAGDINLAGRLADQLNTQYPQSTLVQSYVIPTIRALIEMHKNQPAKAIEALQPTLPYELGEDGFGNLQPAYVRGLAYLMAGQGRKAATEFQKLVDHPGVVGTFVTGALVQLQLARAEEMSGNRDAAREHYQNFFSLWKDADPDVPILKQAKAEYAKLS